MTGGESPSPSRPSRVAVVVGRRDRAVAGTVGGGASGPSRPHPAGRARRRVAGQSRGGPRGGRGAGPGALTSRRRGRTAGPLPGPAAGRGRRPRPRGADRSAGRGARRRGVAGCSERPRRPRRRWPCGCVATGTWPTSRRRAVAVVGARACTVYGEHVAGDLAAGLGDRGWTVVSGGAYGIDAAAHRGSLAVDAPTVAVLACGVDVAYPAAHDGLLRSVRAMGVVVSELPPGARPTRRRFLDRNRVIAALGRGTVVVEAALRSGALNTAGHADELSRTVMAVPGPVTSAASAGCHELLRARGAALVTDAADVLDLVGRPGDRRPRPPPGLREAARRSGPRHVAGAGGPAGTPPGRCRQRRPGGRAGRADRAPRAGPADRLRAGRGAGREVATPPAGTGPGELTTRRRSGRRRAARDPPWAIRLPATARGATPDPPPSDAPRRTV